MCMTRQCTWHTLKVTHKHVSRASLSMYALEVDLYAQVVTFHGGTFYIERFGYGIVSIPLHVYVT